MGILDKYEISYEPEHRIGLYSLDFAIIDAKIDLEIDGDQHHLDERIKDSDLRRDAFMIEQGWKVIRIRWSDYQKLSLTDKEEFVRNVIQELHSSKSEDTTAESVEKMTNNHHAKQIMNRGWLGPELVCKTILYKCDSCTVLQ